MSTLPKGWCLSPLGSISILINGDRGENYPSKSDFIQQGIPFVNAGHLQGRSISLGDMNYISTAKFDALGSGKIIKNDILFCLRGSLGKIGVANNLEQGAIASSLVIVRVNDQISNPYVFYFLEGPLGKLEVKKYDNGSAQPNLSSKNLAKFEIPLAPLLEQKRIADKLDATLARVDACRERLARVAPVLKRFRQSVLAAATNGQLTADWREQQGYSHASNMNKELQVNSIVSSADEGSQTSAVHSERASQAQPNLQVASSQCSTGLTNSTLHEINESTFRKLVLLNNDAGVTYSIPEVWHWASLHGGILSASYGTASKSSKEGKIPVLRMGNLQGGKLDWSDLVYSSDENENLKYALKSGDILFNRTNSPDLVGKTSIYRGERPAIYAGYLIRVQTNPLYLLPEYLNICLNSPYGKDYCWAVKSDGVSQSNINAEKLKNLPLPYCSVNEQTEIVRRVETLFAFADRLETRLASATAAAERLTPSLLAKAFRGELVPQDPNDEPASELLKRLAAQREAAPKAKRAKTSATSTI